MEAKLAIFALRHSISAKLGKNTFPKEFFDEIWLTIWDYEYIYISEIKMENSTPPVKIFVVIVVKYAKNSGAGEVQWTPPFWALKKC